MIKRIETKYIKYVTSTEFSRVLKYILNLRSPSMKMLLLIMAFLGLRVGEATCLKRSDFNKDFSIITYTLLKRKPATKKERAVPIFLQMALKKYLRSWARRMREGYLFFPSYQNQSNNKHLTASSVRDRFKQMRRALHMEDVYYTCQDGKKLHRLSPHTLRHYVAYKLYKASGNDILAARDILGHIKAETTARYVLCIHSRDQETELINKAWREEAKQLVVV